MHPVVNLACDGEVETEKTISKNSVPLIIDPVLVPELV